MTRSCLIVIVLVTTFAAIPAMAEERQTKEPNTSCHESSGENVVYADANVEWQSPDKVEPGFVSLFDGKDLGKWDGDPKLWSVKDGAITGQTTKENPTKGNTFLIWRGGQPADFELRMKVRYEGGNSGVQYRGKPIESTKNDWVVGGYQADLGGGKNHNGKLYEEQGRGALANVGETVVVHADGKIEVVKKDPEAAKLADELKGQEWFDYTIIARGSHLVHQINGHTIIDCTDEQKDKAATSGLIAFQIHAGEPMTVQVRDVRLKDLSKGDENKSGETAGK